MHRFLTCSKNDFFITNSRIALMVNKRTRRDSDTLTMSLPKSLKNVNNIKLLLKVKIKSKER